MSRFRWVLLAVLALCAVCTVVLFRFDRSSDAVDRLWYVDLNTGERFAGPFAAAAPIDAPSGPLRGPVADGMAHEAGVVAIVVRNKATGELRTVYLQCLTLAARELRQRQLAGEELSTADDNRVQGGLRVAKPPAAGEAVTWHSVGSAAGRAITATYDQLMASGTVELALPGD